MVGGLIHYLEHTELRSTSPEALSECIAGWTIATTVSPGSDPVVYELKEFQQETQIVLLALAACSCWPARGLQGAE